MLLFGLIVLAWAEILLLVNTNTIRNKDVINKEVDFIDTKFKDLPIAEITKKQWYT